VSSDGHFAGCQVRVAPWVAILQIPAGHADHLGDLGCHEKVPGWTQGTEKRPDDWDELGRPDDL
jgi:hypothetical protein